MKMVLQTIQSGTFDMFIEQVNGLSFHDVLLWLLIFIHYHLPLLSLFIVIQLFSWIDVGVAESKLFVSETLQYFNISLKIDRSLQIVSNTNNTFVLILEPLRIGSQPVIFSELTRSLIDSILVVLAEVVVMVAFWQSTCCHGAIWHASDDWHGVLHLAIFIIVRRYCRNL